tara:strand:- start:10530 stop:10676 length:147 start_codon:yes stop_codon:yes gene_type:complete
MDSYEPPTATSLAVSKASLMLYIWFKCRAIDVLWTKLLSKAYKIVKEL